MTRIYLGSVFSVSHAVGTQAEGAGVHLRWLIDKNAGLPRSHFLVWKRSQAALPQAALPITPVTLTGNTIVIEWGGDPMAAIVLTGTVDAGQTLTVTGHDGPGGAGHVLDQITGATGTTQLTVYGSGLRSVTVSGRGRINSAISVSMAAILNDGGWTLYERVGLPVDSSFAGSYPMDKQGRIGQETDPAVAARLRLERGGPTAGWAATNDRGQAMPAWQAPASAQLLDELRAGILPGAREMLAGEPASDRHIAYRRSHAIAAPTSIHGDEMDGKAQAQVSPLGALLIGAASDPFAALGLGFGTFVPGSALVARAAAPAGRVAAAAQAPRNVLGLLMVTVDHTLVFRPPLPGMKPVERSVTLADVILRPVAELPPAPQHVEVHREAVTTPGGPEPSSFLDRPAGLDQPYLESVAVRWDRTVASRPDAGAARSYAMSRSRAGLGHELWLQPRASGGHRPFVPARPTAEQPLAQIEAVDRGLREPVLGEAPGAVYSVASQDWFGRWSAWVSADYTRSTVPPQVPALLRVDLVPLGTTEATQGAAVDVELAWNWADRSPQLIGVEVKLHAVGTPVPGGVGSILRVGAGLSAPLVLTFNGSPTLPPGVERIDEPATGAVARYRVRVPGLTLDFGPYPRIAAAVRLIATEHVRPSATSAWSRTLESVAASKVPPAAVPPPPGMVWSALPDPAGIGRASLAWTATAGTRYAIYAADETAVRRELGLAAGDLGVPAHQRLLALRGRTHGNARRAFRRIGDHVTAAPFEVALPRGSRLIHFYVVLPVSGTGVEAPFPTASNDWVAVAVPRPGTPAQPRLAARPTPAGVAVEIVVPAGAITAGRVALHRTSRAEAAHDLDAMGAPLAQTLLATPASGWQVAALPGGAGTRLTFVDTTAPATFAPLWYRAVAWTDGDPTTGVLAARSDASAPALTARAAPAAPALQNVTAVRQGGAVLVRWTCPLPRDRTPLGVAAYSVVGRRTTGGDAATVRRRATGSDVPTVLGALPAAADAPPIFRHHASNPGQAQFGAWLDLGPGPAQVVVQATDPTGRTVSELVELS